MRSATRETTARRVRERIWAISSKVRPSSRRRRVSFAGEETFSLPSLVARSPWRKRRRASRISLPYISTRFSPKPDTRRNSCKFDGSTRHKSSSAESCKDDERGNALLPGGVPPPLPQVVIQFSIHGRFRNSLVKPAAEPNAAGCSEGVAASDAKRRCFACLGRLQFRASPAPAAQASQLPQVSHLGVSPKCWQMWRWRQPSELHEALDFVIALPGAFSSRRGLRFFR